MSVPYTFATATSTIPLSQLDSNFSYFANAISVSSGNVGIGYATPVYKLDVQGTALGTSISNRSDILRTWSTSGSNYPKLSFMNLRTTAGTDWNTTGSRIQASVDNDWMGYIQFNGTGNTYGMSFGTAGPGLTDPNSVTERMRIDSSGYALIGYTSSNGAYKLQVNSQIFATSSTIATSDGKYKENVTPLNNALDLVCALNPVSFDWKQHPVHNFDRSSTTTGFIAQEVQQALQNTEYVNAIVKTNECVLEPAEYETIIIEAAIEEIKDEDGNVIVEAKPAITEQHLIKDAVTEQFLGIAEGNLIALLTASIKELKAELDSVKSQLSTLQGN